VSLEIWLVNDDPTQLLVQKRLLGRFADKVWEFSSPRRLLHHARKHGSCPNLVSDFHMPGMTGLELARLWCELHVDARVLLVSASNLSVDEEREALFLPNTHVKLLSSFRLSELMRAAREWFVGDFEEWDEPEPTTASSLRYFDASVHSKLVTLGGNLFLRKALERFADRWPSRLQNFREALRGSDFSGIYREAHSLKGSCGIVGADPLLKLADQLEAAARREEPPEILDELVNLIEETWKSSEDELDQVLKGL